MKKTITLSVLILVALLTNAQNLLNEPQKIVIDEARNRYLVSNFGSLGDIVMIDSLGNQDYFVKNAGMNDGMQIVEDTVYGSGQGFNGNVKGYDLETGDLVMNLYMAGVQHLSSFVVDSLGILYTSERFGTRIFKINPKTQEYWVFAEGNGIYEPNGLLYEPEKNRLLVCLDSPNPPILAISLNDSTVTTLTTTNINGSDGIAKDLNGYYYITGYYLPGIYKFNPDFSGEPELFFTGNYIVYPTYHEENNSLLITYYNQNNWGEVSLNINLLNHPESVVYDQAYQRYLVSNWENGDIIAIDQTGQQQIFNDTLQHVAGLHINNNVLYACSYQGPLSGIVGFDLLTSDIVFHKQIPGLTLPNGITSDSSGYLYVTAYFSNKLFKININDSSYITLVSSELDSPNGVEFDFINDRLLVMNEGMPNAPINAVDKNTGAVSTLVETNISLTDGLAIDNKGDTYFSSWATGKIYRYDNAFENPPEVFSTGHSGPADIFFDNYNNILAVPNFNSNSVDIIQLASIIQVPSDQPTIQAGINVAETGDTVLVAPGTYYENINFKGKNIVLASHFILDDDLEFINSTIIDGSQAQYADTASCVRIVSGENSTAVLQGFTIKQGTGTHWVDPQFPAWTWHSGGGVFVFQSSPTIKNNYIIDNHVDDDTGVSGASGGGILMYGGNPIIINNVIKNNTALYGAGVVIDYSGCVFKNNIVAQNSGGQNYGGGGFWTIGNVAQPIIIENNTIVNNESELKGGAMYLWSTQLTARNNIIWENTQSSGGQIFLYDGANAEISYTDIEGGYSGEGNIDLPPQLADTNYILDLSSPCIDTGNPDVQFNDPEDPENTGQALWPSQGQLRNDMGAYGGPYTCFLQDITTGINNMLSPFQEINIEVFPNPFSGFTRISVKGNLPSSEQMIEISDIKGQIVKQILISNQSTEYIWNGKNNKGVEIQAGIYFCNLVSINSKETVKVIKFN